MMMAEATDEDKKDTHRTGICRPKVTQEKVTGRLKRTLMLSHEQQPFFLFPFAFTLLIPFFSQHLSAFYHFHPSRLHSCSTLVVATRLRTFSSVGLIVILTSLRGYFSH